MKNVRIFLASFLLLAIASAFVVPKHHAKHAAKAAKAIVNVDEELAWTGANHAPAIPFTLGTTSATELPIAANWASSFQTYPTLNCGTGTTKICKARVTYSYDNSSQSDPLPTGNPTDLANSIQTVINAVSNNYTPSGNPSYFPLVGGVYQFTITISGITITIQVITKS